MGCGDSTPKEADAPPEVEAAKSTEPVKNPTPEAQNLTNEAKEPQKAVDSLVASNAASTEPPTTSTPAPAEEMSKVKEVTNTNEVKEPQKAVDSLVASNAASRALGWQCTSAMLLWLLLSVSITAATSLPLEGPKSGRVASEPSSSFSADFMHVTPVTFDRSHGFLGAPEERHGRALNTCVRGVVS